MSKPFRSTCGYCGARRDTPMKMYDHLMFRHQERFEADVRAAEIRRQQERQTKSQEYVPVFDTFEDDPESRYYDPLHDQNTDGYERND